MPVPHRLHIIWMGTLNPIDVSADGTSNYRRILAWQQALPAWEVNLWVEPGRSLTQGAADQLGQAGVDIHDVAEILNAHQNEEWVTHAWEEIQGGNANFGAASDLLRVAIVLEHGGLYTDLDNFPAARIGDLDDLADGQDLLVGVFTDPQVVNNAVIGGSAGNGFLESMLTEMNAQYRRRYAPSVEDAADYLRIRDGLLERVEGMRDAFAGNRSFTGRLQDKLTEFLVNFHRQSDRLNTTLDMTGPRLLRWLLERDVMDNFDGDFAAYRETGEAGYVDTLTDRLGERAIPVNVIRITSENTWGGEMNFDAYNRVVDNVLIPALDRLQHDWDNR